MKLRSVTSRRVAVYFVESPQHGRTYFPGKGNVTSIRRFVDLRAGLPESRFEFVAGFSRE
ncbi:hypothetical protein [Embleya hyalina]|uniref:hypothetical protein n=1 Tax=Embleya hyalina TaxID=516124 RepID=UPI000F84CD1C|nr:hypothetical protein [Embleya hyalina]